MERRGVRTKEEALPLAERIAGLERVRSAGMQGYEGHCMLEPDRGGAAARGARREREVDRGGRPPRRTRLPV